MNRQYLLTLGAPSGVPRTRGDEPTSIEKRLGDVECSPHTRG